MHPMAFLIRFYLLVRCYHLISLISGVDATISEPFHLWDASEIVNTIASWKQQYPDLVEVSNAQSKYTLPNAGSKKDDCPYDGKHVGCLNHFFTIQDFISNPKSSESSASLPEVLWIGSLHGDEKVGPTVVMETASILLEATSCEAKPSLEARNWDLEITEARECRSSLRDRGVDDTHRQWLARLVATRRIIVVPNANALGHYRNNHLEGDIDPAEDFPFNNDSSESCMRTLAARTINEIFREHLFQIVLYFKEGEDFIEYSWGSQEYLSPDAIAFDRVAKSLSHVVGGEALYPFGPSNAKGVNSKMAFQDWAYAGSWERLRTRTCTPKSFGGYDIGKSEYAVETNRALSFTVSTKSDGTSTERQLDSVGDVLHANDDAEGLTISKNMRLALVATDLVQPYVSIFGINNVALSNDIVPSSPSQSQNMCDTGHVAAVPGALSTVIVEWTVGGGLKISQSDLWVAKIDDIPADSLCSMNLNDGFESIKEFFTRSESRPKVGSGFFSETGPDPSPRESVSKPFSILTQHGSISGEKGNAMGGLPTSTADDSEGGPAFSTSVNLLGPVFRTEIDLADYEVGDRLVVVASAVVDQDWLEPPSGYHQPLVNPQSHIANMRANPSHEFEISGKKLHGRLNWLSIPVTVIVDDIDKHAGSVELYKRFDESTGYQKPANRPINGFYGNAGKKASLPRIAIWMIIATAALVVICGFICAFLIRRRRRRRRSKDDSGRDGVIRSRATVEKSSKKSARRHGSSARVIADRQEEAMEEVSISDLEFSLHGHQSSSC